MVNVKLMSFPLIVMFVISLASIGTIGSSGLPFVGNYEFSELIGTREVSNTEFNMVYNYSGSLDGKDLATIYDEKSSDFPLEDTFLNPERSETIDEIKARLDTTFKQHPGHERIADKLLTEMEDYHDTNSSFVPEDPIYDILTIDPSTMEEFSEFNFYGISINSDLVFIGMFVGIITLASIIGINLFGGGLQGESVAIIVKYLIFFVLWITLSVASKDMILNFPLFGGLLYGTLTLLYVLGVVSSERGP